VVGPALKSETSAVIKQKHSCDQRPLLPVKDLLRSLLQKTLHWGKHPSKNTATHKCPYEKYWYTISNGIQYYLSSLLCMSNYDLR